MHKSSDVLFIEIENECQSILDFIKLTQGDNEIEVAKYVNENHKLYISVIMHMLRKEDYHDSILKVLKKINVGY